METVYYILMSGGKDAVSQLAHAYIWYFIIAVIIVPIIGLVIFIVRTVKQNTVHESEIKINDVGYSKHEEERLLQRAHAKLCEYNLGPDSLTEEEKAVLRKHNINV